MDNFKIGERIPTSQLMVGVVGVVAGNPSNLVYKLKLIGAKQPHNFFHIVRGKYYMYFEKLYNVMYSNYSSSLSLV